MHTELDVLPNLQGHDLLLTVVSLEVIFGARRFAGDGGSVAMVELLVRRAGSSAGGAGEGTNVEGSLEKRPGEGDVGRQDGC